MNVRRHLNLTNALSFAALFVVLGAGAYAAGLGKNSVKSKQIKDGSVATKDIKDSSLGAREVGSITGADVADDSITSADIQAGLRVPSAPNANAVNGMTVKEIDFQSPIANGVVKNLVTFPNIFRIDAQCANVGDGLDIAAFTAVANSRISMVGWRAAGASDTDGAGDVDVTTSEDIVFNTSEAFPIDNNVGFPAGSTHDAHIEFSTPDGFTASIELFMSEQAVGCKVIGTAVGG